MAENNYVTQADEKGSVSISEDVIATIASEAIREVEGVAGFSTTFGGELAERLSKKAPVRGVKILIDEGQVTVDTFILVQYGAVIADVAKATQESVVAGLEAMTGMAVAAVNVSVCGIAFEKK